MEQYNNTNLAFSDKDFAEQFYVVHETRVRADGTLYETTLCRKYNASPSQAATVKTEKARINAAARQMIRRHKDLMHSGCYTFTHFFTLSFKPIYRDWEKAWEILKNLMDTISEVDPDFHFYAAVASRGPHDAIHVHGLCTRDISKELTTLHFNGEYASPAAYSDRSCELIGNDPTLSYEEQYEKVVSYIIAHLREGYLAKRRLNKPMFPGYWNCGSIRANASKRVSFNDYVCSKEELIAMGLDVKKPYMVKTISDSAEGSQAISGEQTPATTDAVAKEDTSPSKVDEVSTQESVCQSRNSKVENTNTMNETAIDDAITSKLQGKKCSFQLSGGMTPFFPTLRRVLKFLPVLSAVSIRRCVTLINKPIIYLLKYRRRPPLNNKDSL